MCLSKMLYILFSNDGDKKSIANHFEIIIVFNYMNLYHVDPSSEKRVSAFYVPRDEAFSEVKQLTFSAKTLYSLFHALIPSIGNVIDDANLGFPYMTAIDSLFSEGIEMPPLTKEGFWKEVMPRLFKVIAGGGDVLRFEVPKPMESMTHSSLLFFFFFKKKKLFELTHCFK